MAIPVCLCTLSPLSTLHEYTNGRFLGLRRVPAFRTSGLFIKEESHFHLGQQADVSFCRFTVRAGTEGSTKSSQSDERIPTWARPDSDEPPPWARDEGNGSTSQQAFEIPFYVYLLSSAVTAIAAVGSIFEYLNQRPVFGILNSDSIFYAPLLGFFTLTGIPTSAFLWFKSVQAANKEAEEQDRRDGYR